MFIIFQFSGQACQPTQRSGFEQGEICGIEIIPQNLASWTRENLSKVQELAVVVSIIFGRRSKNRLWLEERRWHRGQNPKFPSLRASQRVLATFRLHEFSGWILAICQDRDGEQAREILDVIQVWSRLLWIIKLGDCETMSWVSMQCNFAQLVYWRMNYFSNSNNYCNNFKDAVFKIQQYYLCKCWCDQKMKDNFKDAIFKIQQCYSCKCWCDQKMKDNFKDAMFKIQQCYLCKCWKWPKGKVK